MKFPKIIITIFLVNTLYFLQAQRNPENFNPGLQLEDDIYNSMEKYPLSDSKSDDLPLKASLKSFCPPVVDQGEIGSCVGWSTGYAAMTIMYSKMEKWSKKQREKNAFSSMFLYNNILLKKGDCSSGASLHEAGEFLVKSGNCRSTDFDNPISECSRKATQQDYTEAKAYKLKDFYPLFFTYSKPQEKIFNIKRCLADGNPVVIGLSLRKNFANLKKKYWDPEDGTKEDIMPWGAHALTIVGYDEVRNAFEVMNSWGKEWGNNGYAWIKYKDMGQRCIYAYVYVLENNETIEDIEEIYVEIEKDKPENSEVSLKESLHSKEKTILLRGKFVLQTPFVYENEDGSADFGFKESALAYDEGYKYQLTKKDWKIDDKFQLLVKGIQKSKYIYVFSIDNVGLNVHWPRSEKLNSEFREMNEAPIIISDSLQIAIPSEDAVLVKRTKGDDNIIILHSNVKIKDFKERIERMHQAEGDISSRYNEGFSDISVSIESIQYANSSMSFIASLTNDTKTVVPFILVMKDEYK